jgi:protein gp37
VAPSEGALPVTEQTVTGADQSDVLGTRSDKPAENNNQSPKEPSCPANGIPATRRPGFKDALGDEPYVPANLHDDAAFLAHSANQIRGLRKRARADLIEIGRILTECKTRCGHGNWLPWLDREFDWTEMSATRFMNVYELNKSNNLLDLNVADSSLYLLAAPSTPESACAEVINRAESGDRLKHADVQAIIENARKPAIRGPEPASAESTTIILKTHTGDNVSYNLPKGRPTFNATNDQISWAAWSWNPVTGCLHGCKYCYARELATKPSFKGSYPVGFTPLYHHERLSAPANTRVPEDAANDPRKKRVFVCSMADLYGKWVPDEWIEQVHRSCIANPQWDYLFLTKFPRRYVGLKLPPTAWVGTSVDEQKRVRLAEDAFRQIKDVRVKWLSLEPLLEPLQFTDLSMFDWIVIGAQSATRQPDGHVPEFSPPIEWVLRLTAQAKEARCKVYHKPNLLGVPSPQCPGMRLLQEEPGADRPNNSRN